MAEEEAHSCCRLVSCANCDGMLPLMSLPSRSLRHGAPQPTVRATHSAAGSVAAWLLGRRRSRGEACVTVAR